MSNPLALNLAPGGTPIYLGEILLFQCLGANLQLTTDQIFSRMFGGLNYQPTAVVARQRSGAASVAATGGIWDQIAKSGNAIVSSNPNWLTLAPGAIFVPPLNDH